MSDNSPSPSILLKDFGLVDYNTTVQAMREFSRMRTEQTPDELWRLEHFPVFTQGQAGRPEHILNPSAIAIVQSDRGGQVTYHGPGQLVIYTLIDVARRGYGVKSLVQRIEQAMINTLAAYRINARTKDGAPGVYVEQHGIEHKIGSLGLRIRNGKSIHGLSLNVDMDLSPFSQINPCGFAGLAMTQMSAFSTVELAEVADDLSQALIHQLELPPAATK